MADKASPFPFVFTPSCPDRDMSLNVCAPGSGAHKGLAETGHERGGDNAKPFTLEPDLDGGWPLLVTAPSRALPLGL